MDGSELNSDLGPGYYGCAHELDPSDKRLAKYREQRDKRGFDDTETWGLDFAICRFILPRLQRLKKLNHGFPCGMTEAQWDDIQDQIIAGLKAKIAQNGSSFFRNDEEEERWTKAKALLFEHIDHLWD